MKTICFFSGDITRDGGTERVVAAIVNALEKEGKYKILLLSIMEANSSPFFEISDRIPRSCLTAKKKWIKPGPGYAPLIPILRGFLKEESVDIIVDIDSVLDVLSIPARCGLKNQSSYMAAFFL